MPVDHLNTEMRSCATITEVDSIVIVSFVVGKYSVLEINPRNCACTLCICAWRGRFGEVGLIVFYEAGAPPKLSDWHLENPETSNTTRHTNFTP